MLPERRKRRGGSGPGTLARRGVVSSDEPHAASHAAVLCLFDGFRRYGVEPPAYGRAASIIGRMGIRFVSDAIEDLGNANELTVEALEVLLTERGIAEVKMRRIA